MVNNTARNLLQRQLAEVGQTDAAQRFVQLQAVKETSAVLSQLTDGGKTPSGFGQVISDVPKTRGDAV